MQDPRPAVSRTAQWGGAVGGEFSREVDAVNCDSPYNICLITVSPNSEYQRLSPNYLSVLINVMSVVMGTGRLRHKFCFALQIKNLVEAIDWKEGVVDCTKEEEVQILGDSTMQKPQCFRSR